MKNKKNTVKSDYDFIKNKFENDNIVPPQALDAHIILSKAEMSKTSEMSEENKLKRIAFAKTKAFKAIISTAACIAVVLASISLAQPKMFIKEKAQSNVKTDTVSSDIPFFSDYDELKNYLKKCEKEQHITDYYDGIYLNGTYRTGDTVKGVGTDGIYNTAEIIDKSSAGDSAETYKQLDNVDEADIVKTGGNYIYYANNADLQTINIFEADGKKTKLISTIGGFQNTSTDDYFNEEHIEDMFLHNDTLIVNTTISKWDDKKTEEYTCSHIYNISNRKKPSLVKTFKQSGHYVSSRMIDNMLYIVSNNTINSSKDIPLVGYDDGTECKIAANDICYIEDSPISSYIVISAIDVSSNKKETDTKAILGAGSDIYCNEKNMYVIGSIYRYNRLKGHSSSVPVFQSQIIKIFLEGKIKFTASGKVNGHTNNQFSMDEKDGYLRIATTSQNNKGDEINNLYVLDKNLKKVGELTGFAKNESIKAVRFISNTAYVITYEQTDPLFIIDLSMPEKPEIKGSVEITGFSSLLVPVDDNTLLGIGYSTKNTPYGEATNGIKLALFDISNAAKPRVLDSEVLDSRESVAQCNHKALVMNKSSGYYAIPFEGYSGGYNNYDSIGAVTFKIEDNKIKITNEFKKSTFGYNVRCTYIGNTLYLIRSGDKTAEISSFNMNNK